MSTVSSASSATNIQADYLNLLVAQLRNQDPMNPLDGFRIASITKTYTGTLVLQLVDEGKLTLDDTIDKYVSGIPDGDKITMRMLLNHTSGIYDCDDDPGLNETILADPLKQWTPQEMVQYRGQTPILHF